MPTGTSNLKLKCTSNYKQGSESKAESSLNSVDRDMRMRINIHT